MPLGMPWLPKFGVGAPFGRVPLVMPLGRKPELGGGPGPTDGAPGPPWRGIPFIARIGGPVAEPGGPGCGGPLVVTV